MSPLAEKSPEAYVFNFRNRCTYLQQSTRKEEELKFVKSLYRLRPFCEVLQDNFCRLDSLQMNPSNNATSWAQSAMSLSLQTCCLAAIN